MGAVSHRSGFFGCNHASRRCVAEWTRRDSGHGVLLLERLWLNAQQWTDWVRGQQCSSALPFLRVGVCPQSSSELISPGHDLSRTRARIFRPDGVLEWSLELTTFAVRATLLVCGGGVCREVAVGRVCVLPPPGRGQWSRREGWLIWCRVVAGMWLRRGLPVVPTECWSGR